MLLMGFRFIAKAVIMTTCDNHAKAVNAQNALTRSDSQLSEELLQPDSKPLDSLDSRTPNRLFFSAPNFTAATVASSDRLQTSFCNKSSIKQPIQSNSQV